MRRVVEHLEARAGIQIREGINAKQIGSRCRHERGEARCRHLGKAGEQIDVVGMDAERMVDDQQSEWGATSGPEFVLVNLPPHHRTIKLHGLCVVTLEFAFGAIEQSHPDGTGGLGVGVGADRLIGPADEPLEPAPGRLERLETGVVEDGVELPPNHVVEPGYVGRQAIGEFRPGQPLARTDPVRGPMAEKRTVALMLLRERGGGDVESALAAPGEHGKDSGPHRNRRLLVLTSRR